MRGRLHSRAEPRSGGPASPALGGAGPTLHCALALALLSTAPLHPATVEVRTIDGGRLITATVRGGLVDLAEGVLLLVAEADAEGGVTRKLYRLDLACENKPCELEPFAHPLPDDADAVATFDLDGDGIRDVVVGEPGRLYRIGTLSETSAAKLVLEAELDLGTLAESGFLTAEPGRLHVPGLGVLTTFAPDDSGSLAVVRRRELPLRAAREATGLVFSTPPIRLLERPGREPIVAVGPESHGHRRLRSLLLEGGEEVEVWSRLAAPEQVVDSWYVEADGRPALVVATVGAQRIGLFEKKKLRVFPLRGGERGAASRTGGSPSLAVDTASHHWQRLDTKLADVTDDGIADLVVLQPEGMGGKKLLVEAYPGRADARFHSVPLRTVVPAKKAVWTYGTDVTGDGVADLVARSGATLQVFAGLVDDKKKRVLDKKPRWELVLDADGETELRGRPEVRDLDGDGRAEVLVRGQRGVQSVVWVLDPNQ